MAARDALWAGGHDESVEVNQRALIDKVLARYSGEFTVFRELLQNSDDAQSRAVEIHFQTRKFLDGTSDGTNAGETETVGQTGVEAGLPDLKSAVVHQWTFKNNGAIFKDEDWNRLKKIAEGNPDEEKIGAFGVGFYSLFNETDDPFVTSGDNWMGFYWKDNKDQLFARRGKVPATSTPSEWTSFEMPLRSPHCIPSAFDFTRFLASSITFMEHLSEVSVFFDNRRLTRLTKTSGLPKQLAIPKGLKTSSSAGVMNVKGLKSTPLDIKAEVLRWVYSAGTEKPKPIVVKQARPAAPSGQGFFAGVANIFSFTGGNTPQRLPTPLPEPVVERVNQLEVNVTSVTLSIFSADVEVKLDRKMEAELERSTKKKPPKQLKYKLIYTAKAEYDASVKEDKEQKFATGSVFQGLRADLDGTGAARIFIGHATSQTTGLGGHMAARFIPTVERENIDLQDRTVSVWNKELLYVGGFLARSAYEIELDVIRTLWQGAASQTSAPDSDLRSWLLARSLHTVRFFSFHQSAPSPDVSAHLEAAFFACGPSDTFPIMSTSGVRNASEVRMPDETFAAFLQQLPVVPAELLLDGKSMVTSLQARGMIKSITFRDVLDELRSRPLSEKETVACMKWWANCMKGGDNENLLSIRKQMLDAAMLAIGVPGSVDERVIPLGLVQTFINPSKAGAYIPAGSPLPDHVIPLSVTKEFTADTILSAFPWRELTLLDWLRHITNPGIAAANVQYDLNLSAPWAERVVKDVVMRAWPSLPKPTRDDIIALLKDKTCIPTSLGMRKPDESYFANANVFRDLPIVTLSSGMVVKGKLEYFLQELGVRKHVDLNIIFSRMIKTGDWTIPDLIKYLVDVKSSLSDEELNRLRETYAFAKEGEPSPLPGQKGTRYRACDLYEPTEVFRQLQLPLIDWGTKTKWRSSSEEAKFLFQELGLLRCPPLNGILNLAASTDATIRSRALKFFFDHFASRYSDYDPAEFIDIAFVPALKDGVACMGTTKEVFGNPQWALLGFVIAQPNIREEALSKMKIKEHPPSSSLISLLAKRPPKDQKEASGWFGIIAGRISDFSQAQLKELSQMAIVPTLDTGAGGSVVYRAPSQCYFDGNSKAHFHSKLFVFVDFGPQGNNFLSACGTKHEPSVEEISQILLDNPRQFYDLAGGRDNFLIELRNIAVNRRLVSSGTLARMKRAPILLGSQRQLRKSGEKGKIPGYEDLEEDDWDLQYDLRKPDEIIVADDTNAYQFFGDSIFTAPQEDLLEGFYLDLGSRRLSSLVREDYEKSAEVKNSKIAAETRALILERLPLFLHEHTYAQTRVSYSWLNDPRNFIVKTFGKLTVTKSLNYGTVHLSRPQDASAAAKQFSRGPIELWLAGNAQVDMYEVATSLCRLLFASPKVNDALLFMTILSTDLRALKRRGYNVDRILRQQKAQKQAAQDAAKAKLEENTSLIPASPPEVPSKLRQLPPTSTGAPPLPPKKLDAFSTNGASIDGEKDLSISNEERGLTKSGSGLGSKFQHTVQKWGKKLTDSTHGVPGSIAGPSRLDGKGSNMGRSPYAGITPQSHIGHNIDMAIKACTQERHELLHNREQMQMVKEALDEGYCNVSSSVNLSLAGQMGEVKVFVSRDVPEPQLIMTSKRETLARFIYVIRPLAALYNLPMTSLHIFYDIEGPMIAFNRNGSLFLNLRFFESWHDNDTRNGNLTQAYISWYFTLAHEIAHNLVQPHNSEHEFYMSAICQEFIVPFGKLLAQ